MQVADRTYALHQQVQKFLWFCPLFETIRNAKVIGDSAVIELIKQMRHLVYTTKGTIIFNYGTTNAPGGS